MMIMLNTFRAVRDEDSSGGVLCAFQVLCDIKNTFTDEALVGYYYVLV